MSEEKALNLVVVAACLLSLVLDVALLGLGANGALIFVALVMLLVLSSVISNMVMKHYVLLEQRREREATLLR